MKKAITLLAACMLVFGFAGMAAADPCVTCEADPGHIARGCEMGQDISCYPFDYEDFGYCSTIDAPDSYCEKADKGAIHRALFKICDCLTDGTFDSLAEGDTVDISMEILVDKGDGQIEGDNGVYWAENVNSKGVGVEPFQSQIDACADDSCYPGAIFDGVFNYKTASGSLGSPAEGSNCDLSDSERVVYFEAAPGQEPTSHGYVVTSDDDVNNNSVWWIDIPYLRVDPDKVEAGWKVYVKICLYNDLNSGGVCGENNGCCCVIYIGELCCESIVNYGSCVYPYLPPLNTTYWNTMGLAVSNMDDQAGTATITVYEADGDVGTSTVDLAANGIFLWTAATMVPELTQIAGTGTLGDSMSYAVVTGTVMVRGFVMIASSHTGESIGYIPDCCGSICPSDFN
jgi:hypothetical protein